MEIPQVPRRFSKKVSVLATTLKSNFHAPLHGSRD
jgi:hypothetical protein